MKKIIYLILFALPSSLFAQLFISDGETVTVLEGTDVYFDGVQNTSAAPAGGVLDVQATNVETNCVIAGFISPNAHENISFGDKTNLDLRNTNWLVRNQDDERLNDLTMDGAAQVFIDAGYSLTTDGDFNNGNGLYLGADNLGPSGEARYGQLLTLGPIVDFGFTEAKQYFSATSTPGWRQISVPVASSLDQIKDDFSFSYTAVPHTGGPQDSLQNIWWYDATPIGPAPSTAAPGDNSPTNAKHWTFATASENFGPGNNAKAWDIWMGTPNTVADPLSGTTNGGLLTVSGSFFGNGSYTFDLYSTNDYITGQSATVDPLLVTGWNNIPNPYPSNIDVSALLASAGFDITYKAVHVWNPKAGPNPRQQYLAITDGLANFTNWNTGNGVDQTATNIAPFQSFWVQASTSPTTTQTEDIELTNAVRTVDDNPNFFKTTPPNIRLRVADLNEEYTDQTVLAFTTEATIGVDNNDAKKLMSLNRTVPSLYTNAEGIDLSINRLPNPSPYHSIPLHVTSIHKGKEYTIDMRDENIDPAWTIYLEDKKTGTMHNLRNGLYSFNHDATIKGNRFVVHINKMPGNIDPSSWNNVSIYANADGINVAFANPDVATAEVTISNLAGQLIYTGTVSTGRVFTFPINEDIALYAVQVVTGTKVTHDKVVK